MRFDADYTSGVDHIGRAQNLAVARRAWPPPALLIGFAFLGVLAYPWANWHLLAWFSAASLFAYAVTRSPGAAFIDGWLYGSVFFAVLLRWLEYTVRIYSAIPWPFTWLPALALAAYCGLYIGVVAAGVSWLARSRGRTFALAVAPFGSPPSGWSSRLVGPRPG
jgi:apolipoprotein N-acyltransferase